MAQLVKIKLMDKEAEFKLTDNVLTKSSITDAFLLPFDALVSLYRKKITLEKLFPQLRLCNSFWPTLYYVEDGHRISCTSQRLPEPCFLLPNEWPNLHFLAESNVSSQSTTPMGQHIDERSISPYYPTPPPDPAPSAKAFTKWMFYLNDEFGKAATICVHPRFFVTFRHGTHVRLKIGDVVKMYHAEKEINEQHGVEVRVAQIHPTFDFILLKSDSDLVERGPTIAQAEQSEPFTLAGFGNQQQNLSFLPGCIYTTKDYYFDGEGGVRGMGPFIMGTSRSSRGDSGGGIWSARGLLGANSGCTSMPLYDHNVAISEAAIFSAKNLITSAFQFKVAYLEEIRQEKLQEKVPSPPPKKPCVAKWENMGGIFYGSNV